MRSPFVYVQGYGWHVGRALTWSLLWLWSLVSVIPYLMLDVAGKAFFPAARPPLGLIGPAFFVLWLVRRLERKRKGQPFVWHPWFGEENEIELVRLNEQPRRWGQLYRLEIAVWGGAIVLQSALYLFARTVRPWER